MTEAPVCPALNTAAAWPSRTASAASRIDARGLRRSAAEAGSPIPMDFGRVENARGRPRRRRDGAPARVYVGRRARPAATRPADACAATSAPSMMLRGPSSPPIASIAIRMLGRRRGPARRARRTAGPGTRTGAGRHSQCRMLETGADARQRSLTLPRRDGPGAPCSSHSGRRPGEAPSPRGTAGTHRQARAAARHGSGAWPSASSNAGVWDWARVSSPSLDSISFSAAPAAGLPTPACSRSRSGSDSRRTPRTGHGTTARTAASSARPAGTARARVP